MLKIQLSGVFFGGGDLRGQRVVLSRKVVADLGGVFADEAARAAMPQDRPAYEVKAHFPVGEGTAGGLFFGISYLEAGDVGGEFFMTRGHFHKVGDRGEYYWGISGNGVLVLMGRDRKWRVEKVEAGSLHYIPGETAHRLVNVGNERLVVGACWPSDAGHDYATIAEAGFSVRVYRGKGGGVELREVV